MSHDHSHDHHHAEKCVLVRSNNEAGVVNITEIDPVEAPENVYRVDPIHAAPNLNEGLPFGRMSWAASADGSSPLSWLQTFSE